MNEFFARLKNTCGGTKNIAAAKLTVFVENLKEMNQKKNFRDESKRSLSNQTKNHTTMSTLSHCYVHTFKNFFSFDLKCLTTTAR
jgi:hypothetical protein